VIRSRDGQELPNELGKLLLLHMQRADSVALPETEVSPNLTLGNPNLLDKEDDGPQFPVPNGLPGFLFVTGGHHLPECLGKLIFAMTEQQANAAKQHIVVGRVCFLLDITRSLLFGIFEITTNLRDRIDPTFCSDGGRDTPFPKQVRVRSVLEVPPISHDDPKLVEIVSCRKKQGHLNRDQVQRIATLLALRGGKLSNLPAKRVAAAQKEDIVAAEKDARKFEQEFYKKVYVDGLDADSSHVNDKLNKILRKMKEGFQSDVQVRLKEAKSKSEGGKKETYFAVSASSKYKFEKAKKKLDDYLSNLKSDLSRSRKTTDRSSSVNSNNKRKRDEK